VIKKRSISFVISDFMDKAFLQEGLAGEETLKIANKKHDVVAIRIYDQREMDLPSMGLVKMKDAETNELMWIDTANKKVRQNYAAWNLKREATLKKIFAKCGVDTTSIRTDQSYVQPLMKLFKRRERRR
jgi:uncharacterized protein (DUF58 family)